MRKITQLIYLLLFLLTVSQSSSYAFFSKKEVKNIDELKMVFPNKNYEAIVIGKMTKKKIKKIGNFYYTEYKLKTKNWIYKAPEIKDNKYVTVNILGANLKKKGLLVKASTSPDYIPIKEEAIFFLFNTKKKQKNIYTIPKGGVIFGEKLKRYI